MEITTRPRPIFNSLKSKVLKPLLVKLVPPRLVLWRGKRTSRGAVLTFDDGPNLDYTPGVLKLLQTHKVKATFCLLGSMVKKNPGLAKEIVSAGHEIGNHSYTHNGFVRAKLRDVEEEIERTQGIIEKVTGVSPLLFRPPYGNLSLRLLRFCFIKRLTVALWSVDMEDHSETSIGLLRNTLRTQAIKGGDVVLMHDNNPYTMGILPEMIERCQKNGLSLVSVTELLRLGERRPGR